MGRVSATPRSLIALLAAVFLVAVAWALLVPAFQAPDENAHFGYVQSVADGGRLPGDASRRRFSTEQGLASALLRAGQTQGRRASRPEWDPDVYRRWQRQDGALTGAARRDGGGDDPASSNPPVYYLYEAVAYVAAGAGDIFDRLFAMRLASLLWLLVTTAGTWLLAGEVFGRRRALQLTAAAVAGLMPMVTFVSASVSPDAMLYALWTLALWLGVRVIKRGLTPLSGAALLATAGLACSVKATSYALLPAVALALVIGLARARPAPRRAAALVAPAVLAFAVTFGGWLLAAGLLERPAASQVSGAAAAGTNLRELFSFVWQFYLPRLPFQDAVRELPFGNPAYHAFIKGGWAAFGWLEVEFPSPVYVVFALITVGVAVAAGLVLWRTRATIDRGVAAFFAVTVFALMVGLHWTEYHQLKTGQGEFIQGRYLFPLIGLAGLAVANALRLLPRPRRPTGAAVVLAGLLLLQVFSLGLVAERFYA